SMELGKPALSSVHATPSKCSTRPLPNESPASPTAHTSLGAPAHTAVKRAPLTLAADVHALPSKCRIAPSAVTAQTSLCELPAIPRMLLWRATAPRLHPTASKWSIVPSSPTAQMSGGLLPQTAFRN